MSPDAVGPLLRDPLDIKEPKMMGDPKMARIQFLVYALPHNMCNMLGYPLVPAVGVGTFAELRIIVRAHSARCALRPGGFLR